MIKIIMMRMIVTMVMVTTIIIRNKRLLPAIYTHQVRARHDRKIRRANQIREKVVDKPSYAVIPGSPSPKLLMKKKRDDAFPKLQLKSRKISKMPMDGRDSKTSNTSSKRKKDSLVTPDMSYASRRASCVEHEKELLLSLDTHPLLDVCHYRDGQIWLLGNRSLVSLNLSRNYIGEPGLSQLSDMLKVTCSSARDMCATFLGADSCVLLYLSMLHCACVHLSCVLLCQCSIVSKGTRAAVGH